MKRVLVTGGAGFIGSHTCLTLLEKGYEVLVVDSLINSSIKSLQRVCEIAKIKNKLNHERIFFNKGDLRDKDFLQGVFIHSKKIGKPINGVIHFAGLKAVNESLEFPLKYWDMNVNGTINLLNVMNENNCRKIVFSSSATIYAHSSKSIIDEKSKINPINPYGSTKMVVEKLLEDVFNSMPNEWRIINLRYFNPIGAHSSGLIGESPLGSPSNIFPSITQVAAGKLDYFKVYGNDWPTLDGTCIRDFIHVTDLAEGHISALECLENNQSQIRNFNLGTGIGTSVMQLLKTFQEVNNIELPLKFMSRRKGDIPKVIADNSMAIKILKWNPKKNLEQMCSDGWKWQKLNPNGYF
tara:strand:+ start:165 stop:1220 length:1056 start_codon:yes stop_codon:yes gene_type:complete